jgi:hypothetical protein
MMIHWMVSGMVVALLLGNTASAAPLSSLPDNTTASVSNAPLSSPGDLDLGLIKSMLDGHGGVWAQAACQKATEPCDDQHPCCGSLKCKATLFDKTKVCDFRG